MSHQLSRRAWITSGGALLASAGAGLAQSRPSNLTPASDLPESGGVRYVSAEQNRKPFARVIVTLSGSVLDRIDFAGCYVTLHAGDITVRNCKFSATEGVFAAIEGVDRATNITVEDCHFDGLKKDIGAQPMLRVRDGTLIARRCLFENLASDALWTVGGLVERCVFRDAGYLSGAHADAISVPRTISPLRIVDNEIDWRKPPDAKVIPNAAMQIVPTTGDVSDVLVEGNRCRGGTYTLHVGEHGGRLGKHRIERIVIRNNLLSDWLYGPLYPMHKPQDLVFTGNRHLLKGSPLSGAPQRS